MKHDARALVGGAAPRSAKEHVVLALLNAQPDVEHGPDPLLGDGVAPRDVRDEEPRAAAVVSARLRQAEKAEREAKCAAHGVSPAGGVVEEDLGVA